MDVTAVLLALVTLVAGLAAGWALASSRLSAAGAAASRTAAAAAADANAAAASAQAERDAVIEERDRLRAERDGAAAELRLADRRLQEASTKLEALEQSDEQLKDTFARMSSEALQRSSTQFLELADERFKQAGRPLTDTLTKVEGQLRDIEKTRLTAHQSLREQIEFVRTTGEALRTETASLVSALRKPQARGRWGELQLRRCVEFAGMTDRCDFTEQASVTTSDGTLRPDLVVRLVGGKNIVVDSKVALSAYLEAHDATDETVREQRLDAHARHLRQHVDQLAAKSYWAQFSPTPEFVLLFVPGEAFLAPALDRDPSLLEDALAKGVHIVTPTSLVATLRTVAYTWQQNALAANAAQVFELGRELYRRLSTMGDHMDKLGRSLTGAVKDYNRTVGSLEKNVLVTARKLNDLEVVDSELTERVAIDEPVRTLGAPELVAPPEIVRSVVALPSGRDPARRSADRLPADRPGADHAEISQLEIGRADDYGIDAAVPESDRRTGS